jgi:hypothetical protein
MSRPRRIGFDERRLARLDARQVVQRFVERQQIIGAGGSLVQRFVEGDQRGASTSFRPGGVAPLRSAPDACPGGNALEMDVRGAGDPWRLLSLSHASLRGPLD